VTTAREAWYAVEAVHDVVYFAPGASDAYAAVGITGWWKGYFASRAAALGTPDARLVTALFHGFSPDFVRRSVPQVWEVCRPGEVLAARLDLARRCLAPLAGDLALGEPTAALEPVVARADYAGRPLAAAHADVAGAEDPLGRLWQLVTTLREYRGDCHVAVLTAHGLGGAAANVLAEACGLTDGRQQGVRGWSDADWQRARADLAARGWLDDTAVTDTGREMRERIEDETDVAVAAGVDEDALLGASGPLVALAGRIRDSGVVPYPNPTAAPPVS
jgi:hypothetical protein